jgi:hypothetical protein
LDAVGAVSNRTALELAGRDHSGVADDGDEITLTTGFDTQNAEAVLGVVERDAVDQSCEDLGWRARLGWLHHPRMMNRKIRTRYRDDVDAI